MDKNLQIISIAFLFADLISLICPRKLVGQQEAIVIEKKHSQLEQGKTWNLTFRIK
jgi:hypothetical protein